MFKILKTLCIFLGCGFSLIALGYEYPADSIPDNLKKNAFAVVRNYNEELEINSIRKTYTSINKAITVLNENGKKYAWEVQYYDKNKTIMNFEAKMYNASGILIKKWEKKDFVDQSYDPYGTTYTDTRLLLAKPKGTKYPYTIEYNIKYVNNNTYILPRWLPVNRDNLSVERSSLSVRNSGGTNIKFREMNFDSNMVKTKTNNQVTWTLTNYKAIKEEPFRPAYQYYLPYVDIEARYFYYGGYNGYTNSWNEYGNFYNILNDKRDELPDETISKVKRITDTCTTQRMKVKALYEYLQSHTRYISIQVGIGGLQTIPAKRVAETGYGDCKALTNYMKAMLNVAGIKSYNALVKAGANNYYFDKDFVGHQSNHVILCVPMEPDTIWLECTSQTLPFGFLGDFTDNRQVLLITENGGVLTKTPAYTKNKNRISRNATIHIGADGNCQVQLKSDYSGLEYDEKHLFAIEDYEEQKKLLYDYFDFPNFKIITFSLKVKGDINPVLSENVNLSLLNYGSKTGSRMFIPLNLASKWTFTPQKILERNLDIHKKYEATYIDSMVYVLPEGYMVEALPDTCVLENKFGNYKAETLIIGKDLHYIRSFEINSGIFPAADYDNYIKFFENVRKYDQTMAVLKLNK